MAIDDIPIFSMLRTRMQWHQERQRVLAENIANSDVPGFKPHDLAQPKFDTAMPPLLTLARTDAGHLALADDAPSQFAIDSTAKFDRRPGGNRVNLEDEMLKVASNQMDYQAATALYTRSLNLLKVALGKK